MTPITPNRLGRHSLPSDRLSFVLSFDMPLHKSVNFSENRRMRTEYAHPVALP